MWKPVLVGIAVGLALAPSAPRAGDVERVQRACEYLSRGAPPPAANDAIRQLAHARPGIVAASHAAALVDARVYELFCR